MEKHFEFIRCPDCGEQACFYRGVMATEESTQVNVIAHKDKSALMQQDATIEDAVAWMHALHRLGALDHKPSTDNFTAGVINRH